jgi:hypothetical protein
MVMRHEGLLSGLERRVCLGRIEYASTVMAGLDPAIHPLEKRFFEE